MSSRSCARPASRSAIGHSADNLGDAAVVVCSTAIKDNNPEVQAAAERRLPRVRRAEMLAELMRMQKTVAVAGTHGKTTTTSMIAALLDSGGLDPTVINGGIINRYGSNARLGKSDWWVIEADESDGSFLRLDGTIAVVTNIDPEHLEHYGSFDAVKDAFVEFVENVPFYGLAVLCVDHPEVQNIIGRIRDRRIVTYGFSALADVRADNVTPVAGGTRFDALILDRDGERRTIDRPRSDPRPPQCPERAGGDRRRARARYLRRGNRCRVRTVRRCQAPLHQGRRGRRRDHHRRLRPPSDRDPRGALGGARRRRGARDRGHAAAPLHPAAVADGRVPERLQRRRRGVRDARSIPPARSRSRASIPTRWSKGLRAHGHRMVRAVDDLDELCRELRDLAAEGDMVICMGAGDITKWAAALADGICDARATQMSAVATMPQVRGKLTPDAPLAPLVWFKSGGKAEWLFEPEGRGRPRRVPARARSGSAGDGARPRLEPDRPRRRRCRASSCASASRSRRSSSSTKPPCAAAAGRAASSSPRPRATPALPVSSSCAASPARSAASCG